MNRLALLAIICGLAINGSMAARNEGGKSNPPKAEKPKAEVRAEPQAEDIFARKASLTANSLPLKEALAVLARSANLELQLEAEALENVDLNVDERVTITIKDERLGDALSELIDWERHPGAFREVRGQKLIITTLPAREEIILRRLPEWLQPHFNHGLLAALDDQHDIVSITAGVPAPLPDVRLTGDEVTSEAIAKLADREWGTITLADARLSGAVIERLRHVPSIRVLRLFGEGLSGQIPRLETVKGLIGLEIGAPLKGRDLEAIGRLANLESLSLPQEMTINVSGAREIAKLVKLKSLRLYNVNVDDASFVELRTLVRLEELDLTHTNITDEGLTTIVQMPRLRALELHRHPEWHTSQQLSDACLASLARLPELERLSLSGKVTDAGLKQVARWPKLKSLSILSTEITGHGLAALADSTVEDLTLSSGQIRQDEDLEQLKNCRRLRRITVIGKSTGDESRWRMLLPNLDWGFSS